MTQDARLAAALACKSHTLGCSRTSKQRASPDFGMGVKDIRFLGLCAPAGVVQGFELGVRSKCPTLNSVLDFEGFPGVP